LNSCRLKDDYVSDEEEEEDDESDDDDYAGDDNVNVKKHLVVCFPCQYKFRVNVTSNEVIDVWEGNDSEVGSLFVDRLTVK
jgi:hypothetical protein